MTKRHRAAESISFDNDVDFDLGGPRGPRTLKNTELLERSLARALQPCRFVQTAKARKEEAARLKKAKKEAADLEKSSFAKLTAEDFALKSPKVKDVVFEPLANAGASREAEILL